MGSVTSPLKWCEATKIFTFEGDQKWAQRFQTEFWINRIVFELQKPGEIDFDEIITHIITDEMVGLQRRMGRE
jgi:hypothetical protein